MKLYYLEHDLYPATYNFKDEVVGTSGTDITGIDAEGGTDSNIQAIIVAVEDGHRKVIKFTCDGDNGANAYWDRNFDDQTGTKDIELWMEYIDNGQGRHEIRLYNESNVMCVYCRFDAADNEFDVYHGDGVGGNTVVSVAAVASILHHIRIEFNTTTDTYSVWLNGVSIISGENFYADNTATSINYARFFLQTGGGVNALECYIDAWGESWDTDYNIGDNREVDWHDPYNKERITDIDTYPTITPRLNTYCQCNTVLGDFEGAKFDDWYARDFNKILIEDDSGNIMFRGFLIRKIFTKLDLTLFFAGIGALLDWEHFGNEGTINYILAEGLVDLPIPATSVLTLKDNDGNPMGWDADWWIAEGRDVGILIVDATDVNTREWKSSAISQVGGTVIAGNNASTLIFSDIPADYYHVRDTSDPPDLIITPTIDDGIVVAVTDFLKHIEIHYSFRLRVYASGLLPNENKATCHFEILKDTEWLPIASVPASRFLGGHTTNWVMGIPLDVEGGNGNEYYAPDDTDVELRKYFNKDNGNYSELKGLRFKLTGSKPKTGYFEIHVDYINVKVGYMTDDISPIMEAIHDNAVSTVTCDDVSAWDETGVVENDGFRIGENTRVVIQDIASESGLEIDRIDPHNIDSDSNTIDPNADGVVNWQTTGVPHVDEITDANGATMVLAENGDESVTEIFTCPDTITLSKGYVDRITLNVDCRKGIGVSNPTASIYVGGDWEDEEEFTPPAVADIITVVFEGIWAQDDIDALQIRFTAPDTIPPITDCRIYELSITVREAYPNFNKYIAREFKGSYCMEPLKAVCKLEGALWYEDYINDKIILVKKADLVDSGVDLTEADYEDNWEYEDNCNQVKSFLVFGKAEDNIFAKAVDKTVSGHISRQLIDESITNVADAQEIADAQLALVNSKRPSIRLPLKVDNVALQLGTTVDITLARPTVAKTAYPIRKLERVRKGINDIRLTIWVGLGESTEEENVAKFIRDNMFRSHKSLTNRLISP